MRNQFDVEMYNIHNIFISSFVIRVNNGAKEKDISAMESKKITSVQSDAIAIANPLLICCCIVQI